MFSPYTPSAGFRVITYIFAFDAYVVMTTLATGHLHADAFSEVAALCLAIRVAGFVGRAILATLQERL
jgi:hypothetical protein